MSTNLESSNDASTRGQPAPGLHRNIGADVLGPAYAMSQPASPLAFGRDFAQSLEKNLDNASSLWINSMMRAFVAPLDQVRRMTEQFDGGFGSFLWGGLERRRMLVDHEPGDWTPDIDVSRDGQSVQVTTLLPGACEDDIEVEIRDGQLLISGECNFSEDGLSSTHFHESIDLLNAVDSRSVEARVDEEGWLVISLKLHADEARGVD